MTTLPNDLGLDFDLAPANLFAPKASIVVPCYNEADRLNPQAFLTFLSQNTDVEFVFVNDGSQDQTLACLRQLQSHNPNRIRVITLSKNSGKAEAVRQGLNYASHQGVEFVGYWDADLATPLDAIDDFIRVAERLNDVNVVFGSRRQLLGHRIERTVKRRIVSRICAFMARQAVRLSIGDTQCGAKLLRNTNTLREAIATPFNAGWLFDVELFVRIARNTNDARAFYELPLYEWNEIAGSKISSSAIVKSGLSMLRLIAENRLGWPALSTVKSDTPSALVISATSSSDLILAA